MVARAQHKGKDIYYDTQTNQWLYTETMEKITGDEACYECGKKDLFCRVNMPADLSHTGKARWDMKPIDACLAPLVNVLNQAGILTRQSCCGHGRRTPEILLQDGQTIKLARWRD